MSKLTARQAAIGYPWLSRVISQRALLRGQAYHLAKRATDLIIIGGTLPLTAPIFMLCALLIKLEDPAGPVFFIQERTGRGGRRFRMYKFRTMVANAEELKQQLAALNERHWPDFKITNDPRITHIGRVLRKTSLDELPQLLNIIRGEMSLVGPRPTSFSSSNYKLWHTQRLDVLPGLTGLWQIIGRGTTEFDDRLRLDIAYIERRCIRLDLQILMRTIPAVIKQRGAE